jgi:hypothetical protein
MLLQSITGCAHSGCETAVELACSFPYAACMRRFGVDLGPSEGKLSYSNVQRQLPA